MEILFNLIWLIPLYPLLAFAIIVLGLNRSQKASAGLTIAAIALATIHSWGIVFYTVGVYMSTPTHEPTTEVAAESETHAAAPAEEAHTTEAEAEPAAAGEGEATPTVCTGGEPIHIIGCDKSVAWLPYGSSMFYTGFAVDGFTAVMLFMVSFVCLMIFIYAAEYMEGYEAEFGRYSRFFAYVSLFAAGMLMLVIANNLLLLFMAWEIMGLCSYLLIGFWFEKRYPGSDDKIKKPSNPLQALMFWKYPGPMYIKPSLAGLKAFMTTRIGDVLLFSGMLILWSYAGTLTFREIFQPEMLTYLTEVELWGVPVAVLSALLIFGGAVGKSAQFPLHVWLPDAMEGPTPVSALIHAATMVSAGVYLVARMLPLFATIEGSPALQWVAVIGAITAVMGATIGVSQYDAKRVTAYSTISQLGYMMMALGLGGFLAGVFHLLTHSFFKALLFLCDGSIIHAMEHLHHTSHHGHDDHAPAHHDDSGHHDVHHEAPAHEDIDNGYGAYHRTGYDPDNPQDMRNMGGLRHKAPVTFWTYLAGTAALIGLFPFAGFWSKDEILTEAWLHAFDPHHPSALAFWVFVAGIVGAVFTAFYMGRKTGMVFFGPQRTAMAEHAQEPGWRMLGPLVILAFFALTLGFINIPTNIPVIGNGWLHGFAGEVHEVAVPAAPGLALEAVPFNLMVALIAGVLGLASFALGWWLYSGQQTADAPDTIESVPVMGRPIFTILYNKYYFDEIYRGMFIYPTVWLAGICGKFDYQWVINRIVDFVGKFFVVASDGSGVFDQIGIDGYFVNGIPSLVNRFGHQLRLLQTGRVQNYLLLLIIGLLILVGLYLMIYTGQSWSIAALP
jgi:NADH-quinone oxidoreductase subunit L